MTVVKTYKLEPETIQHLQKICEELELTWDGTFTTLANLYAQQKALGTLPERGARSRNSRDSSISCPLPSRMPCRSTRTPMRASARSMRSASRRRDAATRAGTGKSPGGREQARQAEKRQQEAAAAQEALQKAKEWT